MGWLVVVGQVFKALFFLLNLWAEKDKKKAAAKKVVADEITNAFKETNPKTRASRLNAAVSSIDGLR